MRAVVHDRYGPPEVLRLEEVERPVPKDDEILVKVHATTVNRTDCHVRRADPFFWRFFAGLRRPKWRTLGSEFAGEVEAVGSAVTQFEVGHAVFGAMAFLSEGFGTNAEYVCKRERGALAHKPDNLTFEKAAAVCDGAIGALTCLRQAEVRTGRSILVYGASGSIGTAAVQLAKHFGAHVTAVCTTKNVELMAALGADQVVDYTQEDFTRNGETYDVIFDAVGKHSFRRCRRSLKPGGTFLETDLGFMWHVPLLALSTRWIGDKRVSLATPTYTIEDAVFLKELIEAGGYRPVVDRTYPLEDVVEATKYVETEQKTGNVVLTVARGQDR
jgi:NADPH:quinone reductase-like Zn-dependent oxidoreductase